MQKQDSLSSSKKWTFAIIAFLLVLSVTFSIAEIAARLFLPKTTQQSGPGATEARDSTQSTITYHDTLGWFLKPLSETREQSSEFDVMIRINSQGIRADKEYSQKKPLGMRRILVLGDSFTFGKGVENDETYPAFLESSLPNTEVINLGVSAFGTDQQLLALETMGLKYHPDLVILGFYKGDIFRNDDRYHVAQPKPMYQINKSGDLILTNVPVPRETKPAQNRGLLGKLLHKSKVYNILSSRGVWLWEHLGYGQAWSITEAIVRRMDNTVKQTNAEFLVIIFPSEGAIYGNAPVRFIQSRTIARMRELLQRNDIEYIDPTRLMLRAAEKNPDERLYFAIDGHPNSFWNKLVADTLRQHILSGGYLQDLHPSPDQAN